MPQICNVISDKFRTSSFTHHLTTLCYNMMTVALYFNSIDEFPQHAQNAEGKNFLNNRISIEMDNHTLSNADRDILKASFGVLVFFCTVLFISNQLSFVDRVKKFLSYEEEVPAKKNPCRIPDGLTSALFKSITTSSSLFALLVTVMSEASNNKTGFKIGVAVTAACLPGNFFAQSAVFLEHMLGNSKGCLKYISFPRYYAASYALSNAALYFNAFDAAPSHIGLIDHRLTKPESPLDYTLLSIAIISSAIFILATYSRFEERINKMLNPKANTNSSIQSTYNRHEMSINADTVSLNGMDSELVFNHSDISCTDKFNFSTIKGFNGTVSALWKTIVTAGSVLGILAHATHWDKSPDIDETKIACILSVIIMTLPAAIPQLSLYARSNKTIIEDKRKALIDGTIFKKLKAACCQQQHRSSYEVIV